METLYSISIPSTWTRNSDEEDPLVDTWSGPDLTGPRQLKMGFVLFYSIGSDQSEGNYNKFSSRLKTKWPDPHKGQRASSQTSPVKDDKLLILVIEVLGFFVSFPFLGNYHLVLALFVLLSCLRDTHMINDYPLSGIERRGATWQGQLPMWHGGRHQKLQHTHTCLHFVIHHVDGLLCLVAFIIPHYLSKYVVSLIS